MVSLKPKVERVIIENYTLGETRVEIVRKYIKQFFTIFFGLTIKFVKGTQYIFLYVALLRSQKYKDQT